METPRIIVATEQGGPPNRKKKRSHPNEDRPSVKAIGNSISVGDWKSHHKHPFSQ